MNVDANSLSEFPSKINHQHQMAIAEELGNSSSIVGSTSTGCLVSDNNHGSDSEMSYHGDDNDDDDYDSLYDDNDDYMFDDNIDDEIINKNKQEESDDEYSSMQAQFDNVDLPPGVEASIPDLANLNSKASASSGSAVPASLSSNSKEESEKEFDAVQKYLTFKRFDIVDDFSDHHYRSTTGIHAQQTWTKKIHDEWKILESNIPDTIYVRVSERRMDLLRAVIIGPTGTPYHDGLFFFDVRFPSKYPDIPPEVYYHSGGLRINPNLYNNGRVCLSLLNTWTGRGNEKWLPKKSTMLQVLVSIQALILNAQPFFNEPGYEGTYRGIEGEKRSKEYNEKTFILSLKTMMYTLRRPPKHFEDFVSGHFRIWGRAILFACRAYMEGADVGSDVRGKIQDSQETRKLQGFKGQVATIMNSLIASFKEYGLTDCEEFAHTNYQRELNSASNIANLE